jgi:hypothetical protein
VLAVESLATLSGILVFLGTLALLYRWFVVAAALFIVDGAAGVGVFWERWSSQTDAHMKVTAVLSGAPPSADQWGILLTHLPVLFGGLVVLAAVSIPDRQARGSRSPS